MMSHPSFAAISCGHPGSPIYGRTVGNGFNLNDVVSFVCNRGYEMEGPARAQCQANRQWSHPPPTCKENAGVYKLFRSLLPVDLFILSNKWNNGKSKIEYGNFTFGTVVFYDCNPGLLPPTGQWDKPLPECIVVDCGHPGSPPNGLLSGDKFTFGSTLLLC
ncbi:hypothetical protein CRUP_025235 [Coryphaenoides rupestris]|nr:hypothetical protein CRUP_025235 [Coryphaenoides rupestris]